MNDFFMFVLLFGGNFTVSNYLNVGKHRNRIGRISVGLIAASTLALIIAQFGAEASPAAAALRSVPVKVKDQGSTTVVTFEFTQQIGYRLERFGDQVLLHFSRALALDDAYGTHNVHSVKGGVGQALIAVDADSHIRALRKGSKVIVEVSDPLPQQGNAKHNPDSFPLAKTEITSTPNVSSSSLGSGANLSVNTRDLLASSVVTERSVEQSAVQPATNAQLSPAADKAYPATTGSLEKKTSDGSLALMAYETGVSGSKDEGVVLPFARDVGAAAFRLHGEAVVVFDAARPIDLSSARNGILAGARVNMVADTTIVHLDLALSSKLRLDHQADGWKITVAPASELPQTIDVASSRGEIVMMADSPGRIVTVVDPATGGMLLIGTQRSAGQGMVVGHTTPDFQLLPTWQGIAVVPASDRLSLHSSADKIVLAGVGQPLGLPAVDTAMLLAQHAASFTRRFDLPAMSTDTLLRRLDGQFRQVAEAPPLARFEPRMAAAQTMLSLGMGVEAQAMVALAAADDPRHATDPDVMLLSGMGALIAGRTSEADALSDPGLASTDEGALWHATWLADQGVVSPAAGWLFATELSLLHSYPKALRDHLLAPAIEAMVEAGGGAQERARKFMHDNPDDQSLYFAKAILAQKDGQPDLALDLFDRVAKGRDRLARVRASRAAVELRLKTGKLDAGRAADLLEQQIPEWRGDGRELDLRKRIVTLLSESGYWGRAFDMLRETKSLFPNSDQEMRAEVTNLFKHMLDLSGDHLPKPIDFVSLVDDNIDMISSDEIGGQLTAMLADRLVALDLTKRATPVLDKMLATAPQGVTRAEIGAKLAAARLEDGDAKAALATLEDSASANLSDDLNSRRIMLSARAFAQQGDLNHAQALLAQLHSIAADDLRSTMLMKAHDWPAAEAALVQLATAVVPHEGPLDARAQDVLLRLSSAAAQAGDGATLQRMRDTEANRMGPGVTGDMFRLLTAAPVHGVEDLPRAASEMALARTLPSSLHALNAH